MPLRSAEIIAKAESFPGIKAGIARLEDVVTSPSYQAVAGEKWSPNLLTSEARKVEWPQNAASVVILGLHHPENNPRMDWWEGRNTWGNRRLMEISEMLKRWLEIHYGRHAVPLPYYVENGGLFLKDAAVLAGLGVIGRNNLLLNPVWGPHIRLRSFLVEGILEPSAFLEAFTPCRHCEENCHAACPQDSFASGNYDRSRCMMQINTDHDMCGSEGEDPVIRFCRKCEFACPVGMEQKKS